MAAFSIGEDFQATINGPFGAIQIPIMSTFNYEQNATTLQVPGMDGTTRARVVFGNWSGSITFARTDSSLDELAQQIQDTCLANGTIPNGSIDTIIYEQDGSVSNYTFNDVTFTVKSVGDFAAKKTVNQGLNFLAETRT